MTQSIYEQIESNLRDLNIGFDLSEDRDQMRKYNCRLGSRSFEFILVISGLEEIPADMHRIEDHLVKAAMDPNKIDSPTEKIDTKITWKTLDESVKSEILNRLKGNESFSREIFPRHFSSLELLE